MPMDVTKCIAANVKAIREKKKLTLDSAAQATGVSRSMLAQIEKGDVNPTISVLWKIANGFKVSFYLSAGRGKASGCPPGSTDRAACGRRWALPQLPSFWV